MSQLTAWRYRINTFLSNTRGSSVKMLSLSTDTHAKLKAEEASPAIAAILLIYEPVFFAFRDLDQQYGVKSGNYAGSTLGFEQYLDQMPLKLRQWESLIRAVYIEDSEEETAIFPNKRTPFLDGTYEKRLEALGTLKLQTAADAALAAANVQVTSFYNAALGARLVQQTNEGSLKQLSDLRENQRILLSEELMGVLGQLLFIHRHNLVEVERYFDLTLLTNNDDEPVIVNGTIEGEKVVSINEMDPDVEPQPDTVIRIKNTSENPISLVFYAADTPTALPGAGPQFTVNAGQTIEKLFSDFDFDTYTDFNVYNPTTINGSWEVEIEV